MSRILLLIDHKETSQLLRDWLAKHYEVIPHDRAGLEQHFDLCLVDGSALDRHGEQIQACKKRAQPVFLPCLLIRARRGDDQPTSDLGQPVDELINSPIEKMELQVRVESLLRARQMSMEIQYRDAPAWEAQQRLRFLLSTSPAVIYTSHPFGDFAATFITDNVASQMGYLPKDFIGQPSFWIDHVHPEDRPGVISSLPCCAYPRIPLPPPGWQLPLDARRDAPGPRSGRPAAGDRRLLD